MVQDSEKPTQYEHENIDNLGVAQSGNMIVNQGPASLLPGKLIETSNQDFKSPIWFIEKALVDEQRQTSPTFALSSKLGPKKRK